ncbi:MAG: fructosamine kinase family protein, partial [Planctomycetota bacterium]
MGILHPADSELVGKGKRGYRNRMSKSETNGRHDQDEDRWMQWLKNRGLSGTLQRSHLQSLREQIARVDIDGFTSTLHISDGSRLFVKCMPKGVIKRLETEVDGLLALRAVCEPIAGLRVPEVIGGQLCQLSNCAILITRYISEHRRSSTDMRQFGAALARLHHLTRGELVGWHTDNFCGATPQPNAAAAYNEGRRIAWPAFFAQHRLLFQIERLKHRGFVAGSNTDGNDFVRQCLQEKVRRIAADLPRWMETHWSRVAVHEPSVLLHGDL